MFEFEKPDNLVDLIETSVEKYPDNQLFGTKNQNGDYEWVTYREVGTRIDNLRGGLAQIGVEKGDTVGFIGGNRTEWAVTAFATFGLGARFIPMYEKELVQIWKYIINDGGIKVLLVTKKEIYDQIMEFKNEAPTLDKVYIVEDDGKNSMDFLEKTGQENPISSVRPDPNDIAVLIYTSGTTGNPKGVLLSHGNFTSNFIAGGKCLGTISSNSRSLSILPWAHSFGQTGELYNFINYGASIGFVESPATIAEDMAKVRPTILIAVPRVFNKIYDGMWAKMNETGGLAKTLFVMGIENAKKKRQLAESGQKDWLTDLKLKLADAIVFKKIRQRFGGCLELAASGSATMNVEISHFFADIGIPVYDCYGLSETSPAVTMNSPQAHKPGSVGKPIQHVRVVIDKSLTGEDEDDGEVIVYGPNVMHGYQNNPDATKAVMTEDGGLRTGDRGRLDEDGFLHITGRIKEQYKLQNGKYVFPAAIEEEIKLIPYVANAMIYGEAKPFNICLIVPDFEVLGQYARKQGLPSDPQSLSKDESVRDMITREIVSRLETRFRGYEIPRKFIWVDEDFSIENGMLTQTLKLKRRVVTKQYLDQIEHQFANANG